MTNEYKKLIGTDTIKENLEKLRSVYKNISY